MGKVEINTEVLKKLVDAVKELVKETTFHVCQDGVKMQCMDSSHVSLIQINLKDSLGLNTHSRQVSIGLNLDNLSKILRMCDGEEVSLDTSDSCKLFVQSSGSRESLLSVSLLDIDMETMDVPEFEYPSGVCMKNTEFSKIVRDFKDCDDEMSISIIKNSVIFRTCNSRFASCEVKLNAGDDILIEHDAELETTCELSLKYMSSFCKACPLSDSLTIQIGPELPASFRFPVVGSDFIVFFLAPRTGS